MHLIPKRYPTFIWRACFVMLITSLASCTAAEQAEITFSNFGQMVTLVPIDQEGDQDLDFFRVRSAEEASSALTVALDNRLIVKTTGIVEKSELASFHQEINNVTELFTGSDFKYYSVEIDDKEMLAEALAALRQNRRIKLAQPDLLQLAQRSAVQPERDFDSAYLSLLDVPELWRTSKGAGVTVAIIDDGINLQHPDLLHVETVFSYDAESRKLDASPASGFDQHGTRVAGIVFAAHNEIGIDGIAPEAGLISLRQPDTWTSNTLLSFQLAKLAGADLINCSWHSNWLLQPVAEVIEELATIERGGKGIPVVIAAGNQGREVKAGDTESGIMAAIVVGATDAQGRTLTFSNYGETVDIFTYGQRTTTTVGASGYAGFGGTSLAAAITSGYITLLLAENRSLSVDQIVQHLQQKMPRK